MLFVLMVFLVHVSCRQRDVTKEVDKAPAKAASVKPSETGIKDTIGIHKISDQDARDWILELSELTNDLELAKLNNNPARMSFLLNKTQELQMEQIQIQSGLSESDRALFKSYSEGLGNRLMRLAEELMAM